MTNRYFKLIAIKTPFLLLLSQASYSNELLYEFPESDSNLYTLPKTYPARGVSLTNSSVIYTLNRNHEDPSLTEETALKGIDISYDYYWSNLIGYEIGLYGGSTSKLRTGVRISDLRESSLQSKYNIRSISTTGSRATLVAGYNLVEKGFKFLGGVGLYGEKVHINQVEGGVIKDELYGATFKFGIGYNWSAIHLYFWGSVRTDSPEDFRGGSGQGGWRLSYLF